MSSTKNPKVVLFDIGGVCVASPFQSILDYELSLNIPPGWVNYSISMSAPNGSWHRLERGEITMDTEFFAGFNRDLHDAGRWKAFYEAQRTKDPKLPAQLPPIPDIDGEWLFHDMMHSSIDPDPWMFPALQKLKASGHYVIAALSNTVIFPDDHVLATKGFLRNQVKRVFDVFVSSAHVGLRKPDPKIYHLALERVDEFARVNSDGVKGKMLGWGDGVKADEILFLDDIGQNLKAARNEGFQTIKVTLGRAYEAVEELEKVTGLSLAGEHPKIPILPKLNTGKPKM